MDNSKHFLIAFHENNRAKALAIKEELSPTGCSFDLLSAEETDEPGEFNQRMLSSNQYVLLLVSDNLLKESKCMYGGLEAIQQLSGSNRILPVVIDGEYGEETEATVFERVGDVIQYLNYWQDEYISLRQKRRHLTEGDAAQEEVNESLRIVRQVSSEIGEYLRHLRVIKHYSWEELKANDWELFFRLIQFPEGHTQLKAQYFQTPHTAVVDPPEPEPSIQAETPVEEEELSQEEPIQPVVELEGPPAESAPVEESQETAPSEEKIEEEAPSEEDVVPAIEWSELPGIASLGGAPSESPDKGKIEKEDPESVSSLIKKLVDHAEEGHELELDEPEADSAGEETPEPVEHEPSSLEIKEVENLFAEAVSEDTETEEEKEMTVEEPQEGAAILRNAQTQFDQDDVVAGLNLLSQAVEDYPKSADLRYHYAQALLQHAQNSGEAAVELEKLVRLVPEHVPAWFLLGDLAEKSNQFRQARQYYEHSVYLDSDFSEGYFRLGLLLNNHFEDEAKRAAKYFKKAYKRDKGLTEAYYQFGTIQYEQLDKPEKAIKAFLKTLKNQPNHSFANYDLALIYHGLGEKEKAYHFYQQAIGNNAELQTPENDQAFYFEPSPLVVDQVEPEDTPVEATLPEEKKKVRPEMQGIVLITGATSGIGRATAQAYAREGYNLILTGRREDRLDKVQEEIQNEFGVSVRILCFDVRDAEEVAENLNELEDIWRNIDILVNNAGLAKGFAPIHEGELSHWETMIDTNIKGLLYITRVVTPWMVQRKQGQVINIGSIAGKEGYPMGNVYCATKFAVDGLTKAMRMDLHQHGIRVSQICPGHVEETEFALVRFDGDSEKAKIYNDFQPLKSSDIADLILYISRGPAHVNIQDVVITSTQQASAMVIDRSGR